MPLQQTLASKISCAGTGLHSGAPAGLVLSPAEVDTGVVFVCRAGKRRVEIPARAAFVSSTANATTLAREGASVATVEHLLAALVGLGVDNLRVDLDGDEVPGMDGSAEAFVYLLQTAGLKTQDAPRRVLAVRRPVEVVEGLRSIRVEPARAGLAVRYAVDFEHRAIGRQCMEIPKLVPEVFVSDLARARTFGFFREVDALRRAGLARGASLDNTIVLDDDGVMNPGGLRWPNEFVRHKVLDLLGDLALLGHPLRGRVSVERGGHALHRALVDALLEDRAAWKLVDEPDGVGVSPVGPAEYRSPI